MVRMHGREAGIRVDKIILEIRHRHRNIKQWILSKVPVKFSLIRVLSNHHLYD